MQHTHQYIPLDIPSYLAQFLATKLNTTICQENNLQCVAVNGNVKLGKLIISKLSEDTRSVVKQPNGFFFLKITAYTSKNKKGAPQAHRHLLKLTKTAKELLIISIKNEFDNALVNYVKGAEFAHRQSGWRPTQKRKGIRKHAIIDFCKKNNVSPDQKSLETLLKLVQRHINKPYIPRTKTLENVAHAMSF